MYVFGKGVNLLLKFKTRDLGIFCSYSVKVIILEYLWRFEMYWFRNFGNATNVLGVSSYLYEIVIVNEFEEYAPRVKVIPSFLVALIYIVWVVIVLDEERLKVLVFGLSRFIWEGKDSCC